MAFEANSMANEKELVRPTGKILHTPPFGMRIHIVSELDQPVDISHAKKAIQEILVPRGPHFSIVAKNEKGELQWQPTEVNIDDHVFVPHFPAGHMFYDKFVEEYVSDMHSRKLPLSRPLWEFHFRNYKTTTAESTHIINLHHMLGDGVSLMSLAIACSTKADNPSIPPSFPLDSSQQENASYTNS